jgi:DNA ligase (NAD+)
MNNQPRYNEQFIELLDKVSNVMLKHGEPFRAKAYQKAEQSIMTYPNDITTISQLKGVPSIGPTIMEKLKEYVETGTLSILEQEKLNPINIFTDIYGIGPKKAKDLVDKGILTIDELRQHKDELLNETQKVGLKYYEDIQQRIPRDEIDKYYSLFRKVFDNSINLKNGECKDTFEIVGSYRRGAETSGDIDVIITGNANTYTTFINNLSKYGIILEILSSGPSKTLVITKLPNLQGHIFIARRIDFLYSPPDEVAFAILYFTGSKIFNTIMRQHAVNLGYTFNEHNIHKIENKQKGEKVNRNFSCEKDIFDFLGLKYKPPHERRDARDIILLDEKPIVEEKIIIKNKTLKKKSKCKLELIVEEDDINNSVVSLSVSSPLQIINHFKQDGILALYPLTEQQLSTLIHYANNSYYNETSVLTDNQYDIIKEFTQQKYPNNTMVLKIGAEVEKNKVSLPYEMPSMNKIKPDTFALSSWIQKYNGPYVISCKLDGVSGLYTTTGSIPKLYTRGNGKIGQDISHLIPFLNLPNTKDTVIRGELIIPKLVFEQKYKATFANPRNMVAGVINHKHINDAIYDVHFVAYEVIEPTLKPTEQMEFLRSTDAETVLFRQCEALYLTNEMLSTMLVKLRNTYEYEIDGIIVSNNKIYQRSSGNPDHSFAFKMVLTDQVAEAKVVNILWTPSKDGYLKPRVQIEPISLGGVTIEFATGFNGAFIRDNKIGIGATIELIRSGDVIPYIRSITIPAEEPKMPSIPYIWNETNIDVMLENISEDPTVKEKNITGFFRGIGVDGLSSGNIMRLIAAGYDSVDKIILMKENEFLKVEGFKDKMSKKIYGGIQSKLVESSIVSFMAASNIFGRGFSDKKCELILSALPDILISSKTKEIKINEVASLKGMALKTAELFVSKISLFNDFMEKCGLKNILYQPLQINRQLENETQLDNTHSHILFGKSIVLTKTRDKDILDFMKHHGAIQGSGVRKDTYLVIASDKNDNTGKAEDARKLNIPIMSICEFKERFMN